MEWYPSRPVQRVARWHGNAGLRPVLAVGAGTAARRAANHVPPLSAIVRQARERRPPVGTAARRAANHASPNAQNRGDGLERRPLASSPGGGRHSPPKAGGGKDPQLRGGSFSAGIPAFGVIRTLEWQTPFAALRAPCLRPVKADGNEPPAALRAAVPAPTGRTGQRSAFPDRRRHLAWWRTRETCSFTATSWKSVSPIRHAVRSVGTLASRVTVFLVNRLRFPGVRFGP